MTAELTYLLFALGFIGLTGLISWAFYSDRQRMIDRHNAARQSWEDRRELDGHGWRSLLDEQVGRRYEVEADLRAEQVAHAVAKGDLDWARVTLAVQAADADMRYDILAEHRAKVLPMRGAL